MFKRSYELTRVMGIPIRVHIALIVVLILVALSAKLTGVLIAVGIFTSVALHELGHSWVAIRKGCHVHEIMLLPIGGVAKMSNVPAQPRDELLIAAAGPAVSALLAVAFTMLTGLLPQATMLLAYLALINKMLCLFNLLPAFPMDGGRIFRALMTPRMGRLKATALAVRIGRILAMIGGIYGLLNMELMLVFIAIYIYQAAGAEYRSVFAQQTTNQWMRPEEQDIDAEVSPPPYAQSAGLDWDALRKKAGRFFSDLLNKRPIK